MKRHTHLILSDFCLPHSLCAASQPAAFALNVKALRAVSPSGLVADALVGRLFHALNQWADWR